MRTPIFRFLAFVPLVAALSLAGCKERSSGVAASNLREDTGGGNNIDPGSGLFGPDTGGGNNGDPNARNRRLAAFAGQANVPFCVVKGDDVTMTADQLAAAFQRAVRTWSQYLTENEINQRLAGHRGVNLPTTFTLTTDCSAAKLTLYAGSKIQDAQLTAELDGARDSLISAIFKRDAAGLYQAALWIAGSSPAPVPSSATFNDTSVAAIDYAKSKDVDAVLRYLVGRLLGNIQIEGTIMERLPEKLLKCRDEGEEACVRLVEKGVVDDSYSLTTRDADGKGRIKGCYLGFPAILAFDGHHYEFGTGAATWRSNWVGEPTQQTSQQIEVFAEAGEARLFFEASVLSGFSSHGAGGQAKKLYEKLSLNTDGHAARLSVRCGGKERIIFDSSPRSKCDAAWDEQAAAAASQALDKDCK